MYRSGWGAGPGTGMGGNNGGNGMGYESGNGSGYNGYDQAGNMGMNVGFDGAYNNNNNGGMQSGIYHNSHNGSSNMAPLSAQGSAPLSGNSGDAPQAPIILVHISTFIAQGADQQILGATAQNKLLESVKNIDSCQIYPQGAFFSCTSDELSHVVAQLATPAGFVSNITVRDGGDGSVPRWEKIKRELATHNAQVNHQEFIDIILDHHSLYPTDSISFMVNKYVTELRLASAAPVNSASSSITPTNTQQQQQFGASGAQGNANIARKPGSISGPDRQVQHRGTHNGDFSGHSSWADSSMERRSSGRGAHNFSDNGMQRRRDNNSNNNSQYRRDGNLVSDNMYNSNNNNINNHNDRMQKDHSGMQNNRERKQSNRAAGGSTKNKNGGSAAGTTTAAAEASGSMNVDEKEPPVFHATRGKMLLKVNVPLPPNIDIISGMTLPAKSAILRIYENDQPHTAVKEFLFQENVRDESFGTKLTAAIKKSFAPIAAEHQAKVAEELARAETERQTSIEALKAKREQKKLEKQQSGGYNGVGGESVKENTNVNVKEVEMAPTTTDNNHNSNSNQEAAAWGDAMGEYRDAMEQSTWT